MTTTTNNTDPRFPDVPDFRQQLRQASARFLGLDYDGTLAPFAIDPMQATPLPGVVDLLRQILSGGQTEVAILSGRPAHEVATLLDNTPVTIVGSHGFEWWPAGGDKLTRHPTPEQRHGLSGIRDALQQSGRDQTLESKIASLAVHTRGLSAINAASLEQEILAEWGGWALRHGLEWRRFNGGIEVRCTGWNKGSALNALLDRQPDDVLAVYIGDDDTDEDAFTVLRTRGLGIKVGHNDAVTAACAHLADCMAVVGFLRTWLAVTEET